MSKPLPEYTYESGEGPECPFCGHVLISDGPEFFDEKGFEDECPNCGNHIRVEPIVISVYWKTIALKWKEQNQ